MGKLISQTKDLSGIKLYVYNGFRIEELPFFLYEVSINKYWKNGFCVLASKLFKSDKLLNIKKYSKIKRYKDYFIEKSITILGVPFDFIRENNLKLYEPIKRKKK